MEAGDDEIQQKQMLLQTEIIDKNLDKTSFINFCLSKKENGDDLSNWTLPELQAIVKEFAESQSQQQPQGPAVTLQDQITHPNPNPQNPQEQEEINKESVEKLEKFNADEVVKRLAEGIFMELDHLTDMRTLTITLNNEGRVITATHNEGAADERLEDRVNACLAQGTEQSSSDGLCHALPLALSVDDEERMIGVVGLRLEHEPDETWTIVKGMVVRYLATALYSCVIRFEAGFHDIEQIEEESERIRYEENRLHVSNLVLDNSLSTLKHETVWYPNRIVQMVEGIESTPVSERVAGQVSDMKELVDYYREIFGILSQYALSQTTGQLVHRDVFTTGQLVERISAFARKAQQRNRYDGELTVDVGDLSVAADRVMLD
jgi:hypothetical protein